MNDNRIIDFINGRGFAVLAGLLLVLTATLVTATGQVPPTEAGRGMLFTIDEALSSSPWLSPALNVACIVGTALLMQLLSKLFNFVKSLTFVGAGAFFLLELGSPLTSCTFGTGTVLALLLAVGALVLFGCYQDKQAQRPIFLVMCALAFAVMVHWAVVVLIAAFLLGFAYLRAMNWRGVVAALIGLFTPFWIVFGLGLAAPSDVRLMELNPLWQTLDLSQVRLLVGWCAFVVLLTVALTALNLLAIYNYRLQLRVYNSFFVMTSLLAMLAMCADYRHLTAYLPLLNLCLSVQIAHAFTIGRFPKRYIFIIALAAACLGAFAASVAL